MAILRLSSSWIGGLLPAFNFIPFVRPAYNAIFRRLTAQDQDQEVTECAISCLGLVIPMLGDHLKSVLDT
ncbi:cullin-associated NEDD8-dissociated protein 1-like isoform X1 [Physcomitrium patens]|uniref:cullin-associated NEDD8-dissociated protein 1-like isoform X1 n=1 Tax=Physcomitrium patens TaxID=3218 RepID=UPI003CCC9107